MFNSYFTINNTEFNSKDYGLYIDNIIQPNFLEDKDYYTIEAECFFIPDNNTSLYKCYSNIQNKFLYLLNNNSNLKLSFSFDKNYYYKIADIQAIIEDRNTNISKIKITFSVLKYKFLNEEDTLITDMSNIKLNVYELYSFPLFKISMSDMTTATTITIKVNGSETYTLGNVKSGTDNILFYDSYNMECYSNNNTYDLNCNGLYPVLLKGINTISISGDNIKSVVMNSQQVSL